MAIHKTKSKHRYRADIDGLRAVAVASVLLFHAFPGVLPGGFVGVDIFFVISGYLITGLLLPGLERGELDPLDFYRRRIRRIFPALLAVLTACFVVGWNVLFTEEFTLLGKQIAASVAFIQNFVLRSESGYFDVSSDVKPLLHLWSLSVEEQFYLIWPPLLWFAQKLRIQALRVAVLCIAVSFCASVALASYDPVAGFYSPVARFWELLLGAALVIAEQRSKVELTPLVRSALSLAGTVLIAIALVMLAGSAAYPGWRAAIPTIGAAALIAAGPSAPVNRWLLSWSPLVVIGLISYPIYLWHWPLLAFDHILFGGHPSVETRVALLVASVVLAAITFFLVEKPLRFGSQATAKMVGLATLMLLIGSAGAYVWQGGGGNRYIAVHTPATGRAALQRVDPSVRNCDIPASLPVKGWCYSDTREKPAYAILGDSHADALFWSLVRNSRPGGRWIQLARPSCAPIAGVKRVTSSNARTPDEAMDDPALCAAFNAAAQDFVVHSDSIHVVLIVTARRVLEDDTYVAEPGDAPVSNAAFVGLSNLVDKLARAGKQVVFLEDNPSVGNSEDCVSRKTGWPGLDGLLGRQGGAQCELPLDRYRSERAGYLQKVAALKTAHPELTVFDSLSVLCDAVQNRCPMIRDGQVLYSYGDHLSTHGGDIIAAGLSPILETLVASQSGP